MRKWYKSMSPGSYISDDGRFTAELRPAGYYADVGCNLTRHYVIRHKGSSTIIGTARTLAEAARMYL
jgi:hypothetical protein